MSELGGIIADLQSLGLCLDPEAPTRTGGAGPAEGGALVVGGRAVNVPTQSPFVTDSPYTLRREGGQTLLCHRGEPIMPVEAVGRPRFFSLRTPEGVPYSRLALLHGRDCLATTVLQTCVYWDTPSRCSFCGIELSLEAGHTVARKRPEQLAEVARAARELDGVRHVVLTTGTASPPGAELGLLAEAAAAIRRATGLAVHAQFMPPCPQPELERLRRAGVETVGIHVESWDQRVLARHAPAKAALGRAAFEEAWARAVETFGPGQVSSFLLAGLGEEDDSLLEGARRLAELGVYPFLVPLRPIPGSRLAARRPPSARRMRGLYPRVARLLQAAGLSAAQSRAGCVRCGACSALAAWELPPLALTCGPARTRAELEAAHALRHRVFVEEQGLFAQSDRDRHDPASIHLVARREGGVVGTVRVYPVEGEEAAWVGGRLAVARGERAGGAGEALVREAVRTVRRRGCRRFTASIQEANVAWFRHLGWRPRGEPFLLQGRPHQLMQADLSSA